MARSYPSEADELRFLPMSKLENKIQIRKSKYTWEQLYQRNLGTIVPVSLGNNCGSVTWQQSCQCYLGTIVI